MENCNRQGSLRKRDLIGVPVAALVSEPIGVNGDSADSYWMIWYDTNERVRGTGRSSSGWKHDTLGVASIVKKPNAIDALTNGASTKSGERSEG